MTQFSETENIFTQRDQEIILKCHSICEELKRIVNDFSNQVRLGGRLDTLQMRNLVLKVYQAKMLFSQLPMQKKGNLDSYKIFQFIEFEKKISRVSMRALSDQTGWLNDLYQSLHIIQLPSLASFSVVSENSQSISIDGDIEKNQKKIKLEINSITSSVPNLVNDIHPELRNKGFIVVRSDPNGDAILWVSISDISHIFSREEVTGRGVICVDSQWVPIRGCLQLQYGFAIQMEKNSFVLGVKDVLGYCTWENAQTQGANKLEEWLGNLHFGMKESVSGSPPGDQHVA